MALFGTSPEKKFFDMIDKINRESLNKDIDRTYLKYERFRQTWSYQTPMEGDIYYKIKKGEYVTKEDIERVKKIAFDWGIVENDPVYKTYMNVLKEIWELGEKIQHVSPRENPGGPDDSKLEKSKKQSKIKYTNIAVINKDQLEKDIDILLVISQIVDQSIKTGKEISSLKTKYIVDKKLVESVEKNFKNYTSYLDGVLQLMERQANTNNENDQPVLEDYKKKASANKRILNSAKGLMNFFYGANNFYQNGAREFIKRNKPLFDLALKCDVKRYKKLIDKEKMDSDIKAINMEKTGRLAQVVGDAYGDDYSLCKKLYALAKCYN